MAKTLKITTQPAATATSGVALTRQPVVKALNGKNAVAGIIVTVTSTKAGVVVGGGTSAVTNGSGVATFTDLVLIGPTINTSLRFKASTFHDANSAQIALTTATDETGSGTPVAIQPPTVSVSQYSAGPGASVIVSFAGGNGHAGQWIGLFPTGANNDTGDIGFRYLNGTTDVQPDPAPTSGSFAYPLPTTPGTYEFRYEEDDITPDTRTLLTTSGVVTVVSPAAATTPIPGLSDWESHMLSAGAERATYLAAHKDDTDLSAVLINVYYDAMQVFEQIANYTGDSAWHTAVDNAAHIYRDRYVLTTLGYGGVVGAVAGYWNFTTGLRMHYQRTKNTTSRDAVIDLSLNAAFCPDSTPLDWTASFIYSREVAYAIRAYLESEACGAAPRAKRAQLVTQAYDHIKQFQNPTVWGTDQVAPFMMGLTSYILIKDWEQTGDQRCVPALTALWDFVWPRAWVDSQHGMQYSINPNDLRTGVHDGAPDLNLLIAPSFAWLWKQTGAQRFLDRGDLLFSNGVQYAYLGGGKQFDQNYEFSFDYVTWRS
jgi:hypothetical protein